MTWRDKARIGVETIAKRVGTSDKELLRRALRDEYPFGQRKYHPYRMWLEESKKALGNSRTSTGFLLGCPPKQHDSVLPSMREFAIKHGLLAEKKK